MTEMTVVEIPARAPARPSRNASAAVQLAAMMAVSRAVAEGRALAETLDHISEVAADLVGAMAAAIVLRAPESGTGLRVAGQHGLSPTYADYLNTQRPLVFGEGATGKALASGRPVVVADMLTNEQLAPWRDVAVREGFRAMISVPLHLPDGQVIGVLNVFRAMPSAWKRTEVDVLSALGDHAAIAIRTADLLEESRRQIDGLSLLVRSLRAQTHEHSNRLHTIYGLLTLGEAEQARRMVASVEDSYHTSYADVTARVENAVLAGFLIAEAGIAHHSGIALTVDRRSRLSELPASLSDLDAVTLIGNLVHNAVEAVSEMPSKRRRVSVRLQQRSSSIMITVRDWGSGIPAADVPRMFEPYVTTKDGHSGIGLSLVRSIVTRAGGRIEMTRPSSGGLAVTVEVPR